MKKIFINKLVKKNFNPNQFLKLQKFLSSQGIILKKKSSINFGFEKFKTLYLTGFSSFLIIIVAFIIPIFSEFEPQVAKNLKINESNKKFKKVYEGGEIENKSKIDEGLDLSNILEDVFKFEEIPQDTVRLSATTIEQLFKDTNYSLSEVRKSKKVKPIRLSLLPNEIKQIESSTKRKNLFIQIILPLILEENSLILIDRKRLFSILNKNKNSKKEIAWLNRKFKQYGVLNKDIPTLKVRMDIIPVSLAIAQAAKETGWGTSRFALEGNALFGQWTWSGEGLKPKDADASEGHKVMKFNILQASVRAYQRNLNTHKTYKSFRKARAELRDAGKELDSIILSNYLDKYAETGIKYVEIIQQIIEQNNLKDFDDAKLLPSSKKLESLI